MLIQNVIWFASKMTCRLSFYCIEGQYSTFLYHMYGIAFLTQTDLTENKFFKKIYTKFSDCTLLDKHAVPNNRFKNSVIVINNAK